MVLACLYATPTAWAQATFKGPLTCSKASCHEPLAKNVWETIAPFHKKSLEKLRDPKSAAFAAAIGLANPLTVTGRPGDCVSCHASLIGGAPDGISCESCHGAGSLYNSPHQKPEFYARPASNWLGLRDLYNKPRAIAEMCVSCHVTSDPRLKGAKHPTGETFDVAKGLAKMVHWPSDLIEERKRTGYGPAFYAQVAAGAQPLIAARLPKGGAVVAAVPAARPAAPRPASTPDPRFDWDQAQALPADDPGDIVPAGPAPGAPAPAAARVTAPRAPTTAPELPLAPVEPVVPPSPPPAAKGAARTPAAQAAEIRGRAAGLLARLLQARGARQLDLKPATPPVEFDGPDSELFRLQDEVLYQALETLRRPGAEAPAPK